MIASAPQPLPNLSEVDIAVGRIKRNNLLYAQEIAKQRAAQAGLPELYSGAVESRANFQKLEADLRNNLRPNPQPRTGIDPFIYNNSSTTKQAEMLRRAGYRPQLPGDIVAPNSPDRVGLRNQPSPASPPPTTRMGGQRALPAYEPQTIRGAEPRQPVFQKIQPKSPLPFAEPPKPKVGNFDAIPRRMPSGLPQLPVKGIPRALAQGAKVAGKVAVPIQVGIDVARRAEAGQDAGQIAGGVAGGLAGGYAGGLAGSQAGATVGALLGPGGAAVGGFIGLLGGGALGAAAGSGLIDDFTGAAGSRPSSAQPPPPSEHRIPLPGYEGQLATGYLITVGYRWTLNGKGSTGEYNSNGAVSGPLGALQVSIGPYPLPNNESVTIHQPGNGTIAQIDRVDVGSFAITKVSIRRADGKPDYDGSTPTQPAPYPAAGAGLNLQVITMPPSARPAGTPNTGGAPVAMPSSRVAGQTGRGDSPSWVPTGTPAPGLAPSPNVSPQPLGPLLPEPQPKLAPGTGSAPGAGIDPTYRPQDAAKPRERGAGGGATFFPQMQLAWLTPALLSPMVRGIPRANGQKLSSPFKQAPPPNFNFSENSCNIDPCMAGLQRQSQQTNEQVGAIDRKLAALQTGAGLGGEAISTAAIMARLNAIDAKLGAQVPGGIGGLLNNVGQLVDTFSKSFERFAKWAQLDRALNLLTTIATLHNAYMVSNALSQTLFSMISNSLAVFGIKDYSQDKDGQAFDVGKIFSDFTNNVAKAALGAETVDGIKTEWKKYNRIYQAASNVLNSIQSIGYSILGALEILGNWIATIGNALRRFGVVAERAYRVMNPEVNFQNRFFTAIDQIENFASNVDQIAQEVMSVQDTVKNLGTQKKELSDAVGATQTIQKAETDAKTASASPVIAITDQSKPEA